MPIINCPACGKQISDRATSCVHCGLELEPAKPAGKEEGEPEQPTCAECGKPVPPDAEVCPNCGFPLEQESPAERAANEAPSADQGETEGGAPAEPTGDSTGEALGNTVRNVWNSAIFNHSEDEWDEEIRQYYSDDFNDALEMLYADPDVAQKVSDIKANQDSAAELYKKLQNPPAELASAYSTYEDMYDAYVKLTKLATSPSGSLQSFGNDFRQADGDCAEAYEKLKARIPEKK